MDQQLPTIDSCFALGSLPIEIVGIVHKYSDYGLSKGRHLWDFPIPDSTYGRHLAFENNNFAFINNHTTIVVYVNFKFHSQFPISISKARTFEITDLKLVHGEIYLHMTYSIVVYNLNGFHQRSLNFSSSGLGVYKHAFCVDSVGNLYVWINHTIRVYSKDLKREIRPHWLRGAMNNLMVHGFHYCINVDRQDNIYIYGMCGREVVICERSNNHAKTEYPINYIENLIPTPCGQLIVYGYNKTSIVNLNTRAIQKLDDIICLYGYHIAITNAGHIVIETYANSTGLVLSCFH
jgi:hypothetical protein